MKYGEKLREILFLASQIRAAEISDDVVEFMIDRLRRLTSPTRSLLALAACVGSEFDLETLATISQQSVLTTASKRGLVSAAFHDIAPLNQRSSIQQQIRKSQRYLNRLAKDCPENYANKYYLVKAEYARIKGDRTNAMDFYEKAIALAQENKLQHEFALAYELAARFYAQWNQKTIAQTYMMKAYYVYEKWGTIAKCDQLKRCYPYFLEAGV